MNTRFAPRKMSKRQHQAGMATIVVIVILSILLIFAMGNARTLDYLGRDLRLLEQQHKHRIAAQMAQTVNTNQTPSVQAPPAAR